MPIPNTSRLSVSTFSLHRALGVNYRDLPGDDGTRPCTLDYPNPTCNLLNLPDRIADFGIYTLEISHPHLPSREAGYLDDLKGRIREAGVTLLSLLIEAGDITDPEHGERDREWIAGWLETAGRLGAQRARVIAGKQAYTAATLQRSVSAMRELAAVATENGVRLTTENWFALLCCPEAVHSLMDGLGDTVGFNLDFGNWSGPTKYDDLASIFPYAESIHAKCAFAGDYAPDSVDFRHCLELARAADFRGPFTLIYDGPGDDEWKGLGIEREFVLPYV